MVNPAVPAWVQILSALATPIVAASVGVVAYLQWRTAQNRLKLDLFERRYAVYAATREYFGAFLREGTVTLEETRAFHQKVRDAEFLFGPKIWEYCGQLIDSGMKLHMLSKKIQRLPDGAERASAIEEEHEVGTWFDNQRDALTSIFAPYLKLKH